MIQICFPFFCGIFQKLMDMAVPISPYPCTSSGQLRKMERIQIMDNVTGNYTSAKAVIVIDRIRSQYILEGCCKVRCLSMIRN